MQNQNTSAEQTYRMLMIIWFALFMSQFMFFIVVYFAKPELFAFDATKSVLGENPLIILIFALVAVSNLIISVFLGKTFINRAVEEQRVTLIQTGMIVGCALSESISLLGIFLAFSFSYQYFFLWIAFGLFGMILHYPRRDKVYAASYKKPEREL